MSRKPDRSADLRAIADGRLMLNVRNGVTVPRSMLAMIADEIDALLTALEAQAAELAAVKASRDGYAKDAAARATENDRLRAQLAEANKALERHRSERSYVVGWNDGFAHAASEDLKFPTMLRKMWSGGEVQAWLDEQFAARRAREAQGGENG